MAKKIPTIISDELYNLTQLAEVAVKRLSAINKIQVEDFADQSRIVEKTIEKVIDSNKNHEAVNEKLDATTKGLGSIEVQQQLCIDLQLDKIYYPGQQMNKSCNSLTNLNSNEKSAKRIEIFSYSPTLDNHHTQLKNSQHSLPSPIADHQSHKYEHICSECGKKYATFSNLSRHRQTHRPITDKTISMPAFSLYVQTHNQGCECRYCGKTFSRPWLLQGHLRTHTGEKPYKCNVCSKAFADKSNLRAHTQTHSDAKPHTCKRCGKAFALKSYLYKHMKSKCSERRATNTLHRS